jgi:hypothetical protein
MLINSILLSSISSRTWGKVDKPQKQAFREPFSQGFSGDNHRETGGKSWGQVVVIPTRTETEGENPVLFPELSTNRSKIEVEKYTGFPQLIHITPARGVAL